MKQEVLEQCKSYLNERKEQLKKDNAESVNESKPLDADVGELSTSFDNHPADMGTELYDRQKDITLQAHEQEELEEVDHALKSIKKGTYHLCEECGKEISEDRLLAIPTTRYCIDHGK
ncbi:TraR/DksA C4-type zinc finger protein [Gracilibacillus kekensis]|uniref:Transcriptional regulator, TraR/DksA family n=1 Tax=Gracilibacillus kekensis TaxID=1027249 RepID=A0A1M7QKH8_9BACI|nr:TraR/DksA C4-type zinc finger protein [Gracilibacillus kekensis]SHN31728.1 transcriptional regulator, TraR/DksA family [Gracilibacillus kekensis]